jgi:hypothetical protein
MCERSFVMTILIMVQNKDNQKRKNNLRISDKIQLN